MQKGRKQSASIPVIIKPAFSNCNHLATGSVVLQQDLEAIPVGFWALGAVLNLLASGWMHANSAEQLLCMQAVKVRVGPLLKTTPGSEARELQCSCHVNGDLVSQLGCIISCHPVSSMQGEGCMCMTHLVFVQASKQI